MSGSTSDFNIYNRNGQHRVLVSANLLEVRACVSGEPDGGFGMEQGAVS